MCWKNIKIPHKFTCPITLSPFNDPVKAPDGRCYERIALEIWFNDGNNSCPLIPSIPLTNPAQLETDTELLSELKAWISEKSKR